VEKYFSIFNFFWREDRDLPGAKTGKILMMTLEFIPNAFAPISAPPNCYGNRCRDGHAGACTRPALSQSQHRTGLEPVPAGSGTGDLIAFL